MKLFTNFKNLGKGVKRLLIVASFILPFIMGGLMTEFNDEEWFGVSIIICMPIYWMLTFVGLWVYEGFKEDKKNENQF